jgi:hypothetical protein
MQRSLTYVPVLSEEDRISLNNPESYLARMNYIYDPQRGLSHMTATLYMQGLYSTGAALINKGMLPAGHYEKESQLDINIRQRLLAYYHQLDTALKQALFVIKTALDYLPANIILQSALNLNQECRYMTCYPARYRFPNGARFANDHAAFMILVHYIWSNQPRFSDLPLSKKIYEEHMLTNKLSMTLSLYPIFGADVISVENLEDQLAAIMTFKSQPSNFSISENKIPPFMLFQSQDNARSANDESPELTTVAPSSR